MAENTITRRAAIQATGAAFAVGVGAPGTAGADCTTCSEDPDKFCPNRCVRTAEDAPAYDGCPFTERSHVTTVPAGRAGFVWNTCEDGCEQAVEVRFCDATWWVDSSYLELADDCTC